jgi:transposase-like protein
MQEMGKVKEVKSRRKYDDDLKTEILRMRIAAQINSGKNVKEISETFDIAGVHQKVWGN